VNAKDSSHFGTRNFSYPEFALVAWPPKDRPGVEWTCERQGPVSDYAARDFRIESELALSADGKVRRPHSPHQQSRRLHGVFVPLTKVTR